MDFGKASYLHSGKALPFILRRKAAGGLVSTATDDPMNHRRTASSQTSAPVWTTDELEEELKKVSKAVVDIQKQIQRGEETYYEESQTYGGGHNLFQSWEGYIDSREMGGGNGGIGNSRRPLPSEYRWFSTTTRAVAANYTEKSVNSLGSRLPSNYGRPVTIISKGDSEASATPDPSAKNSVEDFKKEPRKEIRQDSGVKEEDKTVAADENDKTAVTAVRSTSARKRSREEENNLVEQEETDDRNKSRKRSREEEKEPKEEEEMKEKPSEEDEDDGEEDEQDAPPPKKKTRNESKKQEGQPKTRESKRSTRRSKRR